MFPKSLLWEIGQKRVTVVKNRVFPTGAVCFPFPTVSFKWESHAFETLGNSFKQYLGKPVHAFETLGNSPTQNNMGNIHWNLNIGKVWYDSLVEWGESRHAVAETFAMKQVVTMMEDAWLTSSGRADVEGLKLWMAKEKGRRDGGVAMAWDFIGWMSWLAFETSLPITNLFKVFF